jgi:uncharacterized protein
MIYLDSCLLIYLIERPNDQGRMVSATLATMQLARADRQSFSISPLVKCECLVGPIKRGDPMLEQAYNELFLQFLSLDMPEIIYLQAAELRARFGVNTPDALHLACAQHHDCEELWTNDARLIRASHGMARNVLTPRIR